MNQYGLRYSVSTVVFCQYCGTLSVLWYSVSTVLLCQYCGILSVLWYSVSTVVLCQYCGTLSVLCQWVRLLQCVSVSVRQYKQSFSRWLRCRVVNLSLQ